MYSFAASFCLSVKEGTPLADFDVSINIDLFSKLIDSFGNKELRKYTLKEQNIARWQQWAIESFKFR